MQGGIMSTSAKLTHLYETAMSIPFNRASKFILMSDCHRGDGSWSDNFLKNQTLFFAALNYYYQRGYTYIELGDGDELWENRSMEQIISIHSDAFWLMSRFYEEGRLYMLYGNHDVVKKNPGFASRTCTSYYCESSRDYIPLFPGVHFPGGLILDNKEDGYKILLAHGHQGDLLNDTLWPAARFLVRYFWKHMELIGFQDTTSAAKNYKKKGRVERRLIKWVESEKHILIAGHTHRPVFPSPGEPPYFNDGSCVHPRCITGLEIFDGKICLIKWTTLSDEKQGLYVGRELLAGPAELSKYAGQL